MVADEAGPPAYGRIRASVCTSVLPWKQTVRNGRTQAMMDMRIYDLPPSRGRWIHRPYRLLFRTQPTPVSSESIAVRVSWAGRIGFGPHLLNRVPDTVDVQIQSDVKKVLVDHCVQARRNERAMLWHFPRRDRSGGEHTSQLHLKFDCSVLVEVPEEPVVVVADRGE